MVTTRYMKRPLAPLLVYSVVLTFFWVTYIAGGRSPTPAFEFLAAYFWAFLTVFWAVADARRRGRVPCFDFGFLCLACYPISVPWYCLWSRGWHGLLTLTLLIGLWATPVFLATVLGMFIWRAA